jgi:hypothetical protein
MARIGHLFHVSELEQLIFSIIEFHVSKIYDGKIYRRCKYRYFITTDRLKNEKKEAIFSNRLKAVILLLSANKNYRWTKVAKII